MNIFEKIMGGLLMVTFMVMGFNAYSIQTIGSSSPTGAVAAEANQPADDMNAVEFQSTGVNEKIIPKGVPAIYGEELGISFDDVSAKDPKKADSTIKKLGMLDQKISLKGDGMKRYIHIAGQMSCEYCCGAPAIIDENGKASCGCAHSFAMRGLAKYLITNHPNEFTDDQILDEMGKWKTLFFPGKISQKAGVLEMKGIELSYINLASNKYQGIENGEQQTNKEKVDMTGWTDNEKMMYEHHGTLPSRLQGKSAPSNQMVGGC